MIFGFCLSCAVTSLLMKFSPISFPLEVMLTYLLSPCLLSAEFEDDPDLYVWKPIKYVGIEVWQVRHMFPFIFFLVFSFRSLCTAFLGNIAL